MPSKPPELPPGTRRPWSFCRQGADSATDPVGCRGIRVPGHKACLAHLGEADRAAYLRTLRPGSDVDHRGTPFTEELLDDLLTGVGDPFLGRPRFGDARFDEAAFAGDAAFTGVYFDGDAGFEGARIDGDARFDGTRIGDAAFVRARIRGDARFVRVVFERAMAVGPLVCARLDLTEAVFEKAVTIEASAGTVTCRRTRWASTASLRLWRGDVDLRDAVLEAPVSIAPRSRPVFPPDPSETAELTGLPQPPEPPGAKAHGKAGGAAAAGPRVRVVSLRGVDAAHLVITGTDLTACRFAGTIHLDQLRMERCELARSPSGLRRRGPRPVRWTPRRTLAEEHHWRAFHGTAPDGWTPAPGDEDVLEPGSLAPVYRQLRKAYEDGKDEPGAADFYYGEMEMRRHDLETPRAERGLLAAYWALSGYGLRASRALGWCLAAMAATVLAMTLWGLPADSPKPVSTGTLTGGGITLTTDTPPPAGPSGPWHERLAADRFDKSLRVVINSAVFRSSGQDLTTAGTYTEMASRLSEPLLLGLAVLAVRGRVKR